MTFSEKKETLTKRIEEVLITYLPKADGPQEKLLEAMRYSVNAGGKRLRPMLMLSSFELFGGKDRSVEPFLAAMEMIHTYSLVHDDLPAMDNDDFRRGKPTTHKAFGEAAAILCGDALLNLSMETACLSFSLAPENPNIPKALSVLYQRSGIFGMIGGQAVDVEADSGRPIDRETLDFIYRLKTGALIEGACTVGAVLAGAPEKDLAVLQKAAKAAGMAFQIRDDILDVEGTFETLGKPVGSDARNQKATFVTLEGLDAARQKVEELTKEAALAFDSIQGDTAFLKELILSLAKRNS